MASYRNTFTNYMSDKSGNHAPVGSILPVFADLNLNTYSAEYTYPQHLYCDGKTLNIRDYPELYSIIGTQYGGSASVTRTSPAQPGGLRRSFVYNDKLFFHFYYDPTNDKTNVKRPYPDNSLFRFAAGTGTLGAFPTGEALDQNTFYRLRIPENSHQSYLDGNAGITEAELNWINAQAVTNEYAYYVTLPASVNLQLYNASDYILTFASPTSDTHPNMIVQKSFSIRDWPYNVGTFNLPDYRQRKILGFGNVNGAGTATPENAVNNFVGQTGGSWYIPKDTLIDSGEFFVIGDVKTTGYNTIVADVSAYVIGSVKYQIGPVDDYVFPFPPRHQHRMLSVEVDETKQSELGASEADKFAVSYINSRANVNVFEPNGSAGGALGHSHGLIGSALQNSLTATYGNVEGVGERESTDPEEEGYTRYMISEAQLVNVSSVTYDSGSGFITVNTDGSHGLAIGDVITINGALPAQYSGNFTIVSDGFGNAAFNVLPRAGEIPASSPASGNAITVKLANGYFVEQEIAQSPRMWPVDNATLVGGKQIDFEIPGDAIIIQDDIFSTPQAATVNVPDASLGEVIAIEIIMTAPGGGGADQDTDGQDAGDASITIDVDGELKTIYCRGGDGGQAGNSGGAGGSGGILEIPAELLSDSRFQFNSTSGDSGDTGGYTGNGGNDTLGGGVGGQVPAGAPTVGGNGTSIAKSQENDGISDNTYTSNGSWSIPPASASEISREIAITVSGGGGGAGNGNANSRCTATWTGWPYSVTGKTNTNGNAQGVPLGGYGGKGQRLQGNITVTAGTLNWVIGNGGNFGKNERAGDNTPGTPGNNPITGVPWGPPFPGGVGTGTESGGDTAGVTGAGSVISGVGGRGAWGNGGSAGSGGGVTGLFLDGNAIAGAGGGGGGGGSGGGFNGGGTEDGCWPGGDARPPDTSLVVTSGALDFVDGGNGSGGGCTAGGGGGGGSGCGVINQAAGGDGGQAGVGHNGNGGGTGGRAGASAYKSTFWNGDVVLDAEGSNPCTGGYVRIRYSNVEQYYDPVGGGGGQGAQCSIVINSIVAPVYINLGGGGNGGGAASNGAGGSIQVTYSGREEGETVPGDETDPTGRYYECDSQGVPVGAPVQDNVWQSSTDDNIKQRSFGAGTGNIAGFIGGSNIPNNTGNQITKYIPFTGSASDSLGLRQLVIGEFDLSSVNKMRFTVIRGSGQNGGENPDQALNVFYQKQGSTNTTLFADILLATNSNPLWQDVELPVAENDGIRDPGITLILEQNRTGDYQTSPTTDDNYGLAAITFFYDATTQSTFVSTGGATLQGNLSAGGLPVNSDDGIDQVRREVSAVDAAIQVNDGQFTMSSSTPITTTAVVTAENNIPLITKYHRVKYLIKAL